MSLGGEPAPSGGGGSRSGNCRSSGHSSAEAGLTTAPPAHITRKATRASGTQAIARRTLHRTHGSAGCFGGPRRRLLEAAPGDYDRDVVTGRSGFALVATVLTLVSGGL